MSPIEQAKALLGADWLNDLEAHLLHGYVLSTPDAFLMGRPVRRGVDVSDPWQTWPVAECDAWFCWCAVGDVARLFAMIPFPLPFVGWNRLGRAWPDNHWLPLAKFVRLKQFQAALFSHAERA